jgi:hypothetical protein
MHKAFLSHATEDKPFAIPLATELRENGIDVWVDQWEIHAGDSLVQKIFEDGIGQAAIVIVVLSQTSVTKKWVKEELDAAVIGRINQTSRLIPLVIEDCDIPVALRATKWIRFNGDLKRVVDEILRAVFGSPQKPPLGSPPAFARNPPPHIQGLDSIDSQVLQAIGNYFFEQNKSSIGKDDLLDLLQSLNLSAQQLDESLEILSDQYYISGTDSIGRRFTLIQIEMRGAEMVLRQRIPDFENQYHRITAHVVNNFAITNKQIASDLSLPLVMINYVLGDIDSKGLIKMSKSLGGSHQVYDVSARLKRSIKDW